jgi:membrane protein DedA with SNARE-associated domain
MRQGVDVEEWMADVGQFIERNRAWAGPILGLITFGESMVFIGAFFPATALMVIAGGLAAAGVLHPVPVVLWCIAGATLGDAVSYWIGRRVGPGAWRHRWMKPHRSALARARLFFRKYGVASIYLCRFMGPVRAFVPLIAGMTAMPHMRFQIANVGSAVIWVPVMLAPGYLAGKGVGAVSGEDMHNLGWVLLAAVVATAAAALAWRAVKRRLKADEPELETAASRRRRSDRR